MANENVANAIYSKLYEILVGPESYKTFFSFINGGYPFSPEDFYFLEPEPSDPTELNIHRDTARAFSNLVNRTPVAVGNWLPDSTIIPNHYSFWVQNMKLPDVQLSNEEEKELEDARKRAIELFDAYDTHRMYYVSARIAVLEWQAKKPTPDNYLSELNRLIDEEKKKYQDWLLLGYKEEYEKNLSTVSYYEGRGYRRLQLDLETAYATIYDRYTDSKGNNFVPVTLNPSGFYKLPQWNLYTFNQEEIHTYEHNSSVRWGGGVTGLYDLFWGSARVASESEKQYYHGTTTKLGIEFEYARVAIDRTPWFNPFLLYSTKWWWEEATPENPTAPPDRVYSNGLEPPGTQGNWVMIPEDAIFIKNLKVTWDKTDVETSNSINSIRGFTSAGFFVFSLKATVQYSDQTRTYDFSDTDYGLIAPHMQLIGFICRLMPKEPNPDPDEIERDENENLYWPFRRQTLEQRIKR